MTSARLASILLACAIGACTQSIEQAIEDLHHAEAERRQAAAHSLAGRVDAESAQPLLALLEDSEAGVRAAAIETLATVTDSDLITSLTASMLAGGAGSSLSAEAGRLPRRWGQPALQTLLRPLPPNAGPDQETRLLTMLAPFEDPGAIGAVALRLTRPGPLRSTALDALRDNPAAAPALAEMLSGGESDRSALIAAAALLHLGQESYRKRFLELALAAQELPALRNLFIGIDGISPELRTEILEAIASADPQRSSNAIVLAGVFAVSEAGAALLEVLQDATADPIRRAAAATSLGELGETAAAPALVQSLVEQFELEFEPWLDEGCEETEPGNFVCDLTERGEALQLLRQAALLALPHLGPAMVEPALSAIAEGNLAFWDLHGRLQVEDDVLRAFTEAGDEAIEVVLGVAQSDPDPELLQAAVAVMEYAGGKRSEDVLISLLTSEDEQAVELAADALAGPDHAAAVSPLLDAMPRLQDRYLDVLDAWDGRYPNAAARALVAIGQPSVEAVRPYLAAADPATLAPAIFVSARLRDREAAPALMGLIDHPDEDVRDGAFLALGALRHLPVLEPLLERAGRVRGTHEAYVSLPIIFKALGMLQAPGAIPLLREFARDPEYSWEATMALGEFPEHAVGQDMLAALEAGDLHTVGAAHQFYIRHAVPGSESKLIAALDEWGNADLALDFVNCGNPRLAAAGREWLEANDYFLIQTDVQQQVLWGSQ